MFSGKIERIFRTDGGLHGPPSAQLRPGRTRQDALPLTPQRIGMNFASELESSAIIAFSDCDPFGHLNNGRYIDYFLNAREEQLEAYYDLSLIDWSRRGLGWFVTQNQIAYLRPANYREKVILVSRLTTYSESTLQIEMLMYDEHKKSSKHCTGRSLVISI